MPGAGYPSKWWPSRDEEWVCKPSRFLGVSRILFDAIPSMRYACPVTEERRLAKRKWQQENRGKIAASVRAWYAKNPEKKRSSNMYRRYGMTLEDYDQMFERQNGLCALCGEPPSDRALVVDHDHSTKAVRGLLHHRCNIALGVLGDDPVLAAEKLLAYSRRHAPVVQRKNSSFTRKRSVVQFHPDAQGP